MPGCGKSTCGVLLAKALLMDFFDTDLIIQKNEKESLQNIINIKGDEYFALAEENAICRTDFNSSVIATGGSVVYSKNVMDYLKIASKTVYLRISYETMIKRISNIKTRGILLRNGETLSEMFNNRKVLYEKYADIIIDCDLDDVETTVRKIKGNI